MRRNYFLISLQSDFNQILMYLFKMEERERSRERVCESDEEESWSQDVNGDSVSHLQSGGRKRSFGIESKTFLVETEKKKGRMQIFIVERKGDVSSWIKLGPASLGPLIEGLLCCSKDMRTGYWEKRWQEKGRFFSLVRGENKGGWFLRLGVIDRAKNRFSIFVPKGRGAKGGWVLLAEALREMESSPGGQARRGQGQILDTHVGKTLCGGGQAKRQHRRRGG